MSRPIVGITGDVKSDIFSMKICYASAIEKAGACPVFLPTSANTHGIRTLAKTIDALLISGGGDINPRFYGEKQKAELNLVSGSRFYFEKKLLKEIITLKKPVLGLCYGMQFLNVFQGGTLYQDLAMQMPDLINHKSPHKIKIYNGSKLYYILKKDNIRVNSSHHQGIKESGNGLKICAFSEDDVIEAIELLNYPFCIGVQWHPERLSDIYSRRLFQSFVTAGKR